jgi:hypothetical protein
LEDYNSEDNNQNSTNGGSSHILDNYGEEYFNFKDIHQKNSSTDEQIKEIKAIEVSIKCLNSTNRLI